jgi:ethanolamine permease
MAAEEARDPHRSVPVAYIGGILTLVALALGVMIFAGGSGDWTKLANINDPLPQAMKIVVGASSGWLHMLVWLGLFGLVASFHGIIIGYSRQAFRALARRLPAGGARPHPSPPRHAARRDPRRRSGRHRGDLRRRARQVRRPVADRQHRHVSVFGAIVMYILSMASLFRLRRSEPLLERPFRAPTYPVFPAFALAAAVLWLATMVYFNPLRAGVFAGLAAIGYGYFLTTNGRRDAALARSADSAAT